MQVSLTDSYLPDDGLGRGPPGTRGGGDLGRLEGGADQQAVGRRLARRRRRELGT